MFIEVTNFYNKTKKYCVNVKHIARFRVHHETYREGWDPPEKFGTKITMSMRTPFGLSVMDEVVCSITYDELKILIDKTMETGKNIWKD